VRSFWKTVITKVPRLPLPITPRTMRSAAKAGDAANVPAVNRNLLRFEVMFHLRRYDISAMESFIGWGNSGEGRACWNDCWVGRLSGDSLPTRTSVSTVTRQGAWVLGNEWEFRRAVRWDAQEPGSVDRASCWHRP